MRRLAEQSLHSPPSLSGVSQPLANEFIRMPAVYKGTKKNMVRTTESIHICLPISLREAIDEDSSEQGLSRSGFIAQLLAKRYKRALPVEPQSRPKRRKKGGVKQQH